MPPLPLPAATRISSPSAHNSLLTTRSTSSENLIPLYVILGVITLLVLACTVSGGCCCCCYQARKAYESRYQTVAGNTRHTIFHTNNRRRRHRRSNQPSNALSVRRSHIDATRPRSTHFSQAAPSESYTASPRANMASFYNRQAPRLALTYPAASHTEHVQRSQSWGYPWQPQLQRNQNRSPPPLSRSRSTYNTYHSRPADIYTPQQPFESYTHSLPRPHVPLLRPGSMASQGGRYDHRYALSLRLNPRYEYERLSWPSSRERSERRASRPELLPSLSSDGRPRLSSDC